MNEHLKADIILLKMLLLHLEETCNVKLLCKIMKNKWNWMSGECVGGAKICSCRDVIIDVENKKKQH